MGRSASGDTARVLVISGSVGAGHDGAAAELIERLRGHGVSAERRDFLDAVPWFARFVLREGYTLSIGYAPALFDWVFDSLERSGWVQRLTLGLCQLARRRVRRWARGYPVVVSTYPLASQALGQLRAAGELDAVTATFLTDPAVHRMWVHPDVDHHLTVTEATSRMGRLVYRTAMRPVGGLVSARFTSGCPPTSAANCAPSSGCAPTCRSRWWSPAHSALATYRQRCARSPAPRPPRCWCCAGATRSCVPSWTPAPGWSRSAGGTTCPP
jgi:monogalactosyldiacylglycerol (MGDG) synthase